MNRCKMCGNATKWNRNKHEYRTYCSCKCANTDKSVSEKRKQTCISRYGVTNVMQSKLITKNIESPFKRKEVRDKAKQTFKQKYTEYKTCPLQIQKFKQKMYNTNLVKYGFENVFQNENIKEKAKQSTYDRFGVYNVTQNFEIHKKQQKSALKTKTYTLPSNKIINLQGYEPQFLDYLFKNKYLTENEIILGAKQVNKIIYYDKDNKKHYYYPDFYIPKFNLIVEIKSKYTMSSLMDKNLFYKEEATKKSGFNYIRIVDNDFNAFYENYLSKGSIACTTPNLNLPSLVNP